MISIITHPITEGFIYYFIGDCLMYCDVDLRERGERLIIKKTWQYSSKQNILYKLEHWDARQITKILVVHFE